MDDDELLDKVADHLMGVPDSNTWQVLAEEERAKNAKLRDALAAAPLVHEVLGHPEHYQQWYAKSREVLNA